MTDADETLARIRNSMGWGDASRNPMEDANCALGLCDRLKSEGWQAKLVMQPNHWVVALSHDTKGDYGSFDASLPMAICMAFLKVMDAHELHVLTPDPIVPT